jgi:ComF family protein
VSLRAVADRLLSLLLAPPCAVCGRVLTQPLAGAVCEDCWTSIDAHTSHFFLRAVSEARAIGAYEATLRDVIHALKYDGRRSIAPRLSALMAEHGADVLRGADIVVPVPLHASRRRQRGFNQAEDLARGLGLPVLNALRRVRATQPQVELPAEARKENVKHAFALRRPSIQGTIVVLVDDVATTGATLDACAKVLTKAGARDVRALTAARVATGLRQTPRA